MEEVGYDNFDYLDESILDGYGDYPEGVDLPLHPEDDSDEHSFTAFDMLEHCIHPTFHDAIPEIFKLLAWCFIFRVSTQILTMPRIICHLMSMSIGLIVLFSFFSKSIVYLIMGALVPYIALVIIFRCTTSSKCGVVVSIASVAFIILCEFYVVDLTTWHKIRGAQMVLMMKSISLAFDIDSQLVKRFPNPIEYFGYVVCPGSCVFGPWFSYKNYHDMFKVKKWNLWWPVKILVSYTLCLLFLSISTCWSYWVIPADSWKWLSAYRDALSFRSSHYFISYLSEASSVTAGMGLYAIESWNVQVAHPWHIEVPRSLVEVVVYWNKPMHYWLKTYVFKTMKPFGTFAAIILTYTASSVLHGLSFQLFAVLLSLGFYTYVEHVLRQKLAGIFQACILSRKCKENCKHTFKQKNVYVIIVNFVFSMVTVLHLAYLGLMFDAAPHLQEIGYSYLHTLSKWAMLDFTSHWIVFFSYLAYLLI